MLWPILLICAVVGVVVVLALIFAQDPPAEGERQPGSPTTLDRFLAEARDDRGTRQETPRQSRSIPTTRPRQRPRPQPRPAERKPEPVPTPVVVIRKVAEPELVAPVVVEPLPEATPMPTESRPAGSPGVGKLMGLLRDRDGLQAAFLLNEILRPPLSRRGRPR